MSHLQLSRAQPIALQRDLAPIEILPADIRNIIYSSLAPIDQFKVNCFKELRQVFNPYEIYLLDFDSNDFELLVYMYSEVKMYDKISQIIYNKYKQSPRDITHRLRRFRPYNEVFFYDCAFEYSIFNFMPDLMKSDIYIVFLRFCLIKFCNHQKILDNINEVNDLWEYQEDCYDKKLEDINSVYYCVYKTLIKQILNTDSAKLYDILDEYFINTESKIVQQMLTYMVNIDMCLNNHKYKNIARAEWGMSLNCLLTSINKNPILTSKIIRAHFRYLTNLNELFRMYAEDLVDKCTTIDYILFSIANSNYWISNLLNKINKAQSTWPKVSYDFIYQNTVISDYLHLTTGAE